MSKYDLTPTVKSYLDRIGATSLNCRRAAVIHYSEEFNYPTHKCSIIFTNTGEIKCKNKEYAPTDAERDAIIEEWKTTNYPKPIQALNTNELMPKIAKGSTIYELRDRRTGNIRMVQERRETPMGKAFPSWTLFDDGNWMNLEPDGLLPFWKPHEKLKHAKGIMIHEGAKSASIVNELCFSPFKSEARKLYPKDWLDYLSLYEHWGMIGGADGAGRADWDEVRAEKPKVVIYICDNDRPGLDATKDVARHYDGKIWVFRFDEGFPPSQDFGDDLPESMFNAKGQWIGKPFNAFLDFATMATKELPNPSGEGKNIIVLSHAFKEAVTHTEDDLYVINDFPGKQYNAKGINNKMAPFSHVDDVARLIRRDDVGKGSKLVYEPGKPSGIIGSVDGGGRVINTYVGSSIKPIKGDPQPFLDFLEHLIPDANDLLQAMRWMATLIARPDVRMTYAMLLISEAQGVGKTTLAERILAPLVGIHNVSFPNEKDLTDSNFNEWSAHTLLAIIAEMYAGDSNKAYDVCKSIITDKYITVKKKYINNYILRNRLHILASSNSMRALTIAQDDRRWFVPEVTEKIKPVEFWRDFNYWLTNEQGLNIIAYWAAEFVKTDMVKEGETAPNSSRKEDLKMESLSRGLVIVDGFLHFLKEFIKLSDIEELEKWGIKDKERYYIKDTDLVELISVVLYDCKRDSRLERPLTIRKHAKNVGYFINKDRAFLAGEWHAAAIGPRIICSNKEDVAINPKELQKRGEVPVKVIELYRDKCATSEGIAGSPKKDGNNVVDASDKFRQK